MRSNRSDAVGRAGLCRTGWSLSDRLNAVGQPGFCPVCRSSGWMPQLGSVRSVGCRSSGGMRSDRLDSVNHARPTASSRRGAGAAPADGALPPLARLAPRAQQVLGRQLLETHEAEALAAEVGVRVEVLE